MANKARTAEAMKAKGLAKKPRAAKGAGKPGKSSPHAVAAEALPTAADADQPEEYFRLVTEHIDPTTDKGRRRLAVLEQIRNEGLPIRLLMASEMARAFSVEDAMARGEIEPAKGHVQLDKIADRLRHLAVEDMAPDDTVPGNIEVVNEVPEEDGPGDPIVIRSAREARDDMDGVA